MDIYKSDFSKEAMQEYLSQAIEMIKGFTGLNLKISQLVRIRQLVEEACEEGKSPALSRVCWPHWETAMRFLWEYYGINGGNFHNLKKMLELNEYLQCSECVKEWFKMKQDEMFLL
jgi:hypothetical protein